MPFFLFENNVLGAALKSAISFTSFGLSNDDVSKPTSPRSLTYLCRRYPVSMDGKSKRSHTHETSTIHGMPCTYYYNFPAVHISCSFCILEIRSQIWVSLTCGSLSLAHGVDINTPPPRNIGFHNIFPFTVPNKIEAGGEGGTFST